jgi:NTE family protein
MPHHAEIKERIMQNQLSPIHPGRLADAAFAVSRQVWLAGLGAGAVTRHWVKNSAGSTLRALVKEGSAVETQAIRVLGSGVETSIATASSMWNRSRKQVRATVMALADTAAAALPKLSATTKPRKAKVHVAKARKSAKARVASRAKRVTRRVKHGKSARYAAGSSPDEFMSGKSRARRRRSDTRAASSGPRIGLALAGGGPLGGIYEVGALIALSDSLAGIDFNDIDVYVGVSSGGFVAAALANGISPTQMYRLFIDVGADASLSPALFLRPALGEFARRSWSLPRSLLTATLRRERPLGRRTLLQSLTAVAGAFGRTIPTGIFNQRALDRFLTRLFATAGRSNDFRELRSKLFLIATHLDSGASTTFGAPGLDHVPITKAVAASAALPGLFPPVVIDGAHYVDGALNKTLHASVALDEGVQLLLCINALVPFDSTPAPGRQALDRLAQGGLPMVLAQAFRAIIHSRMEAGMERYRAQYPGADILLFEPQRGDADMFFAPIFSYARRKSLCEAAYRTTRAHLFDRRDVLAPMLARHGIRLKLDALSDRQRPITDALIDTRRLKARKAGVHQAARDLSHTLDRLEAWLAAKALAD